MHDLTRYARNMEAFSPQELEQIRTKQICIIGCGGLGGYVGQALIRFGIGKLTIVDGDVFSESNLNRQLFSKPDNLGQNKAEVAKQSLTLINSDPTIIALPLMLTAENAIDIIQGHDLVIDCLDSVGPRLVLAKACAELNLPLVHGAIAGFFGQVANILPGSGLLERLYPEIGLAGQSLDQKKGNPVFTPQLVAALQCSEALKLLANRPEVLRNAVLHINLLHNTFEIVDYPCD